MAGSNGKATAQAERHARRAKEKADARREQATGATAASTEKARRWRAMPSDTRARPDRIDIARAVARG